MVTDWVEITVTVTPDTEEAIANILCELGSNGVVTDAGTEESGTVAGYVPAGERIQEKLRSIRTLWQELCKLGLATGVCQIAVRSVPMSDWTGWQARFKPVRVSDRIVVTPPWAPVSERENQVVIEIVPGLAFGTGEHETTRLCLHALEEHVAQPVGYGPVIAWPQLVHLRAADELHRQDAAAAAVGVHAREFDSLHVSEVVAEAFVVGGLEPEVGLLDDPHHELLDLLDHGGGANGWM